MSVFALSSLAWLIQNLADLDLPIWVWIILGILVLAIVLGFILGERTSVRRSPSMHETNIKEGTVIIPETGSDEPPEIPQTGLEATTEITGRAVTKAEGPLEDQALTLIEGIDPPIQQVLYGAGINTFDQLARTNVSDLEGILARSGVRRANPATWPEQARLAHAGRLEELRAWQKNLKDTL